MHIVTSIESIDAEQRSLVLLSGGFDSVACALALRDHGNDIVGLSFNYSGRPAREREQLAAIAAEEDLPIIHVDIPEAQDARIAFPEYVGTRKEAWFPFRNLIFLSLGCHLALRERCEVLAMGVRKWDVDAYDDAAPRFFASFADLAAASGNGQLEYPRTICLPHITDHAFAADCYRRHADVLDLTWSCWRDGAVPCEQCAPCKTRRQFLDTLNRDETAFGGSSHV